MIGVASRRLRIIRKALPSSSSRPLSRASNSGMSSGSRTRSRQHQDTSVPGDATGISSVSNGQSSSGSADAKMQEAAQPQTVPLKLVVTEAVRRWFGESLQEAERGDVKQQALLGQMYAEGYGCDKNVKAAREWSDKARSRNYVMKGVYCEL